MWGERSGATWGLRRVEVGAKVTGAWAHSSSSSSSHRFEAWERLHYVHIYKENRYVAWERLYYVHIYIYINRYVAWERLRGGVAMSRSFWTLPHT